MSSPPVRVLEVVAPAPEHPHPRVPSPSRWVADAVHHAWETFIHFYLTSVEVTLRPRRFAAEWAEGKRQAPNPITYFASAVAFSSPVLLLVKHLVGSSGGYSYAGVVVHHFEPYLQWLILGLICHAVLKPLNRGGRSLAFTVGLSLFAGGGPAVFADILAVVVAALASSFSGGPASLTSVTLEWLTIVSILGANLAFMATFALGLAGLHGLRVWRPILALSGAYILLTLLRVAFFKALHASHD